MSTNEAAKARIKQILSDCCAGNSSLATEILTEEFVIIDRADIPYSVVEEDAIKIPGSPNWSLGNQTSETLFNQAIRLISRAEAVARHEEELANTAQRELESEAVAICNKAVGLPFEAKAPAMNMDHWTKVALAAREVYGVTK